MELFIPCSFQNSVYQEHRMCKILFPSVICMYIKLTFLTCLLPSVPGTRTFKIWRSTLAKWFSSFLLPPYLINFWSKFRGNWFLSIASFTALVLALWNYIEFAQINFNNFLIQGAAPKSGLTQYCAQYYESPDLDTAPCTFVDIFHMK